MKNYSKTIRSINFCKTIIVFYAFYFLNVTSAFSQFSTGNLVVLQSGDGVTALANTGNPIILKEFSPLGVPGITVTVPSTGTNALIISGSATSEGALTLSQNKKYLVFGGYAQILPNVTPVAASSATLINRGIGIVDAAAGYTRAATSSTFFSANNIRGAVSDGLNNFWASGANDGTNYFGNVGPAVTVQSITVNTRMANIFSGNLYFSTGSGTTGIYQVGAGLPTTSGQTNTQIINTTGIGTGGPSPYAFYFNPAQTVCYIADDRTPANGGGIQKWILSGSWTYTYTLPTGAAFGARGVVADFSGPNPQVYATTSEGTSNRLISITDVGPSSTATTIATSPASNAIFRGVAFAPCSPPVITVNSPSICAGASATLTASGANTYTWDGGANTASILVTPSVTTNYTISGTTAGCVGTNTTAVNVNPLPTLTVATSNSVLCAGQSATISVTGANTYSWNTGAATTSIVISPTTTTNYTVTGTSVFGCVKSATFSQNVTQCTRIAKNEADGIDINIYPNPAINELKVQFGNSGVNFKIEIFDFQGKLIQTTSLKDDGVIAIGNLPKGIYVLKASNQFNSLFKKFIKE